VGLEAGEDRVIDSVSSQHVAQNRFLTDEHSIMSLCGVVVGYGDE